MFGVLFKVGSLSFLEWAEFSDLPVDHLSVDSGHNDLREMARATGLISRLNGAPLASWLLARLQKLFLLSGEVSSLAETEDDLGGYRLEFLVVEETTPVALLSVEADSAELFLGTQAETAETAKAVVQQFVAELFANPLAVARCELLVPAAELDGENEYGWDGHYFLGAANVSE